MAESPITELHNEFLEYLSEQTKLIPDFRFTLRKSNKENRLAKGFYFYGNDHYLAVSFWSGTDWKNRTPNIIFVVVPGEGKMYLEISVGDSTQKEEFVNNFIVPQIGLYSDGRKIYRNIEGTSFLNGLENFIQNEKVIIDRVVSEHQNFFGDLDNENRIGFIPEKQFILRLQKALAIKDKLWEDGLAFAKVALRSLQVRNFGRIFETAIQDLPADNQWIFITGGNGTGKTTVLRSIALAIMPHQEDLLDLEDTGHLEVSALVTVGGRNILLETSAQEIFRRPQLRTIGFAAYGASRLIIGSRQIKKSLTPEIFSRRQEPTYSLFHTDGILFDFAREMALLYNRSENETIGIERLNIIVETLIECIGPLANIIIEDLEKGQYKEPRINCLFVEQDSEGNHFYAVNFDQLSTGIRSLVAMFGDMIVRLFAQQPDVYDIAELRGIVLIDEIDIHFHPEQQKEIVEILTTSFPKIQFIVTTHSPIPLLGAPKNSVIIRMKRSVKHGIVAERIDTMVDFSELLPNTILTSPIFGLRSVVPDAAQPKSDIRTEDNWKEIKLQDAVREELKEIYKRLSNQE